MAVDTGKIDTRRLSLRRWRADDIRFLPPILADPDVMRFSDHGPFDTDELDFWLKENIAETSGEGACGARAIELKSKRAVIGYASLSSSLGRTEMGEAELGVRLAKRHWTRGYASEAATGLIEFAFRDEAISRIIGIVDPNNHRSVRMLGKLGMVFERDIEFDGYDHPDHLYALVRKS